MFVVPDDARGLVPDTRSMTTIHAAAHASPRLPGPAIAGHRLPMLDQARIYACGITPYDVTHLGHGEAILLVGVTDAELVDLRVPEDRVPSGPGCPVDVEFLVQARGRLRPGKSSVSGRVLDQIAPAPGVVGVDLLVHTNHVVPEVHALRVRVVQLGP